MHQEVLARPSGRSPPCASFSQERGAPQASSCPLLSGLILSCERNGILVPGRLWTAGRQLPWRGWAPAHSCRPWPSGHGVLRSPPVPERGPNRPVLRAACRRGGRAGAGSGTGPTGLSDGGAVLRALLPPSPSQERHQLPRTPWEPQEPEAWPEAATSLRLDRWGGAGAHLPEAPAAFPTADCPLSWALC